MQRSGMVLRVAAVAVLSAFGLVGMVSSPTASFVMSPSNPAAGSPVQFTDTSAGGAATWSWTFGDGQNSNSQSPVHTFDQPGQYPVTLTASNGGGQSQTQLMVDVSPEDTLRLLAGAGHSFDVTLVATNQHAAGNPQGVGKAIPQNDVYGFFTLPTLVPEAPGAPLVPEVFVKMLDARAIPGQDFWLFWGQLSDLGFALQVKDNVTGAIKIKGNPATDNPICLGSDTSGFENVATPTPTPAGGGAPTPTPTPTPPPNNAHLVTVGANGMTQFVDQQTGSHVTTIHVGDTVTWQWMGGPHSTTSGTCSGNGGGYYGMPDCTADGNWDAGDHTAGYMYQHTFMKTGTFKYYCQVHGAEMTASVVVTAAQ